MKHLPGEFVSAPRQSLLSWDGLFVSALARYFLAAAFCLLCGIFPGRSANVTVNMVPGFQFSPSTDTVQVGDTVTWVNTDFSFHDTTSGVNGNPSGQWSSGLLSHNSSFAHTFLQAGTFPYYCTPHRLFGMLGSIVVQPPANVAPSISITNPPDGAPFNAGDDITIIASATDSDGSIAKVEFFVNGNLAGTVTGPTYSITLNSVSAGNYSLTARATDNQGASTTSAAVNVVVNPSTAPAITAQPQNQIQPPGSTVLFSVTATGTPPLRYQWQFNGTNILGATNAILTLTNVQSANSGNYAVIVSNGGGSVTSLSALLDVRILNPPTVAIVSPTNGAAVLVGSTISIVAQPVSGGLPITKVEFFVRSFPQLDAGIVYGFPVINIFTKIGEATNAPYEVQFQSESFSIYTFFARASDARGSGDSSSVVVYSFLGETARPRIFLTTAPPNYSRLTNGQITLSGTATTAGSQMMKDIQFRINLGDFRSMFPPPADNPVLLRRNSSWTGTIQLVPGDNLVQLRGIDLAGNESGLISRTFKYVVESRLTVQTTGSGAVIPIANQSVLDVGQFYQLQAIPTRDHIFAGWTASGDTNLLSNSNRALLRFQMQSNLVLTAHFIPNPFPSRRGNYSAPLNSTNGEPVGAISMTLTGRGTFSAKAILPGQVFSFSGQFDAAGDATAAFLNRPGRPVALTLHLDFNTNAFTGSITDGTWSYDVAPPP